MEAGLKGFHLPHQLDSESNVILNGRRRSVSDVTNVLNRGSTGIANINSEDIEVEKCGATLMWAPGQPRQFMLND
eukprot:4229075-Prymnesium_polylepis.1